MKTPHQNTTEAAENAAGVLYYTPIVNGLLQRISLDTRADKPALIIETVNAATLLPVPGAARTELKLSDITTVKKAVAFRVLKFKDADDGCKRKQITYIGTEPEDAP